MRWAAAVVVLAAGCASPPPPATPQPTPVPSRQVAPTPTPTPVLMPTAVPTVPPPRAMPVDDLDSPRVRVLLTRSSSVVELPQPGRTYRVTADGKSSWMWGPLRFQVTAAGSRWWQVGAYSDPSSTASAMTRLQQAFGNAVQVGQVPTSGGLTRVRIRWPSGEPTDPVSVLASAGFPGGFAKPAPGVLRIDGEQSASVSSANEMLIEPAGEWPVTVEGRRYRGRLRVRAVGDEALIINELNLESYLKGVVPAEMGPSQFPELDALKAQTVAARTYAVAHLGDHDDEGWDLCDTPACQVYKGVGVEHRLSDRAVSETAGLVAVFNDKPINAMYTSTCGGHTEDASLLFPGSVQPYLTGVPCAWERLLPLAGTGEVGPWVSSSEFSAAVLRSVLSLEFQATPNEILRRVQEFTGVSATVLAPVDVEAFSLALLQAVGVDPPAGIAPSDSALDRLLFLADLYKIFLDPPTSGLGGAWPAAAATAALELRGDIARDSGEAVPRTNGTGIFPRRADHGEDLPSSLPLWERWRGGFRALAQAEVRPGTALERWRYGDRVVALVVLRSGGDGEADRRSAWREWVRERSWAELERSLGVANLERLTVTRRSPSGRVVGMVAVSASGTTREWSGFDVRRALELPETLFNMHLRQTPDGEKMVRFLGRGWGHGVGLCQNGAYGLARAGMGFEQILGHYYTGIQIVRWQPDSVNVLSR